MADLMDFTVQEGTGMSNNVYGVILAGGKGTRMGNIERPKQFLEIGGKPILIHTIEKFVIFQEFDKIIVLSPKSWIAHTKDLIKKYIPISGKLEVIAGGSTRNETIMNAIDYIDQHFGLDEETIIVTHDSVRPFVTCRMIEENIRFAKEYGACDTVIPASDTIVESKNHMVISSIPDRSIMYQGQTPQSFKAKRLRDIYQNMADEEKDILTDACKIMVMKGETVRIVEGDVSNIKVTYPSDIRMAESLLGGR